MIDQILVGLLLSIPALLPLLFALLVTYSFAQKKQYARGFIAGTVTVMVLLIGELLLFASKLRCEFGLGPCNVHDLIIDFTALWGSGYVLKAVGLTALLEGMLLVRWSREFGMPSPQE